MPTFFFFHPTPLFILSNPHEVQNDWKRLSSGNIFVGKAESYQLLELTIAHLFNFSCRKFLMHCCLNFIRSQIKYKNNLHPYFQ